MFLWSLPSRVPWLRMRKPRGSPSQGGRWEISLQYAMFATPIAYLIDEQGILASDVAVGVEPILALAEQPVRHDARSLALTS